MAQYSANGYSLYDMAGNFWQWCSDGYRPKTCARIKLEGAKVTKNRQGPTSSYNPGEEQLQPVHRGGSFLCVDQYCTRYVVGTRGKGDVDTATHHLDRTVLMMLVLCSFSVSVAIFLISDMSHPLRGVIEVSSGSIVDAFERISQE